MKYWSMAAAISGALLLPACGGGSSSGGSAARMTIVESSNGFGQILPHRVRVADAQGLPTDDVVDIRSLSDLAANVTLTNPLFPPTAWPDTALLPDGTAGNHFLYTRFQQPIDVDSVLDGASGASLDSHLRGAISILAVNAATGAITKIRGRAFIGGQTFGGVDSNDPTKLVLERWIGIEGGRPVALEINGERPGLGFPGTEGGAFAGAADLVSSATFVFVPDEDGDLSTYETFPTGVQVRMRMTTGVRAKNGGQLEQEGLASATVGQDLVRPEVLVSGATNVPVITPGNGDLDVDPETNIVVEFTEPIQLPTIGKMPDGRPPTLSAAILVQFGPSSSTVTVPFHARPFSPYDLARLELMPAYPFPGSGPEAGDSCGNFSTIRIFVNSGQVADLATIPNMNSISAETSFTTGEGPGLVNAPVTPDALYVARGGSRPGLSVVDLNGYGDSTGNPSYDPLFPIVKGNSNAPNNPNKALQGSLLIPPLTRGTCTVDGGSAGVFTLTKDSALRDLLASSPILESVGDVALGHALDNTFNNALPFGCQSGGGNICAASGLKIVAISPGGPNSQIPSTLSTVAPIKTVVGTENLVSWAPHPNPPPLTFPPLCLSPLIGSVEPTSIASPVGNLLAPGSLPLGRPADNIPPQGLLARELNTFFEGPTPPQQNISSCVSYMMRQQVGQFLYVVDRVAAQIVVLNSNRMTVIERIPVPDPTSLAMSPNLEMLAVTNESADVVTFIDVNPASAGFHSVTKTVRVGAGPTGIAWEPGNEDIFVCNQRDSSVSILSAFTLEVRKTLRSQITAPIDVAITPRQMGFGFQRGVYFAYILNGNGSLALFESGPNGVNGWGFDDVIGTPTFRFANPKAIAADVSNLNSGVWIVHEDPLGSDGQPLGVGGGAVSHVALTSGLIGIVPLDPGSFVNPSVRDLGFQVLASIGPDQLTGVPVDIAFDNQVMQTSLTNWSTQYSAGFPLSINGKSLVKSNGNVIVPVSAPQFMFLAVPNSLEGPGVIDVINLAAGFQRFDTDPFQNGVQSIPATGVIGLSDYIRQ